MKRPDFSRLSGDYIIIASMMEVAIEHGLEAEVVWTFYNILKSRPDTTIEEAVVESLSDWDL